ncbi:MAG: hypothetical protein ACI9MR_001591 [Myxococcota bacterium]|jgi:hypothetical protein
MKVGMQMVGRFSRAWARPLYTVLVVTLLVGCSADDGGTADTGSDTADSILIPGDALFDTGNGPTDSGQTATATTDSSAPSCAAGSPCDDGDLCTVNDQCINGACMGTALTCGDNLPCTEDRCVAGQCRSAPMPGFCVVNGICWSDAQPNPINACERCVPTAAQTEWSNAEGLKCDDGDPCTEGEACTQGDCGGGTTPAEVCDDQMDNDCNGATDLADETCGGIVECTYHTDCYPERLCGRWETNGMLRCSDPCTGTLDCEDGMICSKVPGSAQVGFCEAVDATRFPNGAGCTDDMQCQSRVCAEGKCNDLCLNQAACTQGGQTCHPVGDLAAGIVLSACSDNPVGALGNGQICSRDGGQTYGGDVCASGHCDLMPLGTGNLPCAQLCKGESDCAPSKECSVVLYSPSASPNAVPYDALFAQPTHDTVTACYSPPTAGGTATVGTPCTQPSQCRSNKCLPLLVGDDQRFCTTYCEFDQECPSAMGCKLEATNLASSWLQATHNGSQQAAPGAWSLVRLCKFD